MSRKLTAAALALTVAGGVYLSGGTAQASNMGFKLERSFSLQRDGGGRNFANIYYVSFPLFNGLGDVADSNHAVKCVGDVAPLPVGPTVGDGVINSHDAMCDMWTDRTGSFAFVAFNRNNCTFGSSTVARGPFGYNFGGAPFTLERDAGFQIVIGSSGPAITPVNRAVIVGSHDPSYAGRTITAPTPDCSPRLDIISLPYHSIYKTAAEILCGLEGSDWVDDLPAPTGDGNPDSCYDRINNQATGVFDGTRQISVQSFDNDPTDTHTPDNAFYSYSVRSFLGNLQFSGSNFDLRPGDGYVLVLSAGHTPTQWLSPYF